MAACAILPTGLGPSAVAAFIAALLGISGWLAKGFVSWAAYRHKRYTDEMEMMIALKAEVALNIAVERAYADDGLHAALEQKYFEDARHKLFVPLYRHNVVFDAFRARVTGIVERPLAKVIEYYNLSGGLDVLLTALTSERFESLKTQRKLEIYKNTIAAAKRTVEAGEAAVAQLVLSIRAAKLRRVLDPLLSLAMLCVAAASVLSFSAEISQCAAPASKTVVPVFGLFSHERR